MNFYKISSLSHFPDFIPRTFETIGSWKVQNFDKACLDQHKIWTWTCISLNVNSYNCHHVPFYPDIPISDKNKLEADTLADEERAAVVKGE